jgi:hypothetical protein
MRQRTEGRKVGGVRWLVPLALIALLALPLPAAATHTDASYDASCSSGDICLYAGLNFNVPLAATGSSDSAYTNDVYPNTSTTLNDTVSSLDNKGTTHNTLHYFDIDWSGTSFCLRRGYVVADLAGHNNQYSSHLWHTNSCP